MEDAVPGYTHLAVEPHTPNIGATIHAVDLSQIRSENLRVELRKTLAEFQALLFRRQTLTPQQQVAVARVFGDPDKAKAYFSRHESQTVIELIETKPVGHRYGTGQWHVDIPSRPTRRPARCSIRT